MVDGCIGVIIFFFQAEDGIRDLTVTGVQTCALPICLPAGDGVLPGVVRDGLQGRPVLAAGGAARDRDRKSTRLNSSHSQISYAVFCLKKKKKARARRNIPTPLQDHCAGTTLRCPLSP